MGKVCQISLYGKLTDLHHPNRHLSVCQVKILQPAGAGAYSEDAAVAIVSGQDVLHTGNTNNMRAEIQWYVFSPSAFSLSPYCCELQVAAIPRYALWFPLLASVRWYFCRPWRSFHAGSWLCPNYIHLLVCPNAVHSGIAEFWCTITSPIYLLPMLVVYQCGGLYSLPPTAHFALLSTFCTAVCL